MSWATARAPPRKRPKRQRRAKPCVTGRPWKNSRVSSLLHPSVTGPARATRRIVGVPAASAACVIEEFIARAGCRINLVLAAEPRHAEQLAEDIALFNRARTGSVAETRRDVADARRDI